MRDDVLYQADTLDISGQTDGEADKFIKLDLSLFHDRVAPGGDGDGRDDAQTVCPTQTDPAEHSAALPHISLACQFAVFGRKLVKQ